MVTKMDEQQARKIMAEAEKLHAAGDHEGAEALIRDAMHEAADQGAALGFSQIEAVANFVQKSVQVALQEILDTAKAMDSTTVPVEFIEFVMEATPTGVAQLWKSVEVLEVPIDYGVPSDLSELEDL